MSVLPNNTFANLRTPLYAPLGGGGGASLQSPVNILPEANGNVNLNVVATTGAGEATVLIASDVLGGNAGLTIGTTTGGSASILMGDAASPDAAVALVYPGAVLGGGELNIQNVTSGLPVAVFDTVNNAVILGNDTTAGASALTTIKNGLKVADVPITGSANGIGITMTTANIGVIAGTASGAGTNTLQIGSSQNAVDTISLVDGGANTGYALIGGNGGENIYVAGGTGGAFPNIRTDAGNSGTLTLGASVANNQLMFLKDQVAAGTGVVDITNGTAASTALRLQANTPSVPGANTVRLSTNLPFAGSNAGGQVRITTAYDGGGVLQNYTGIELQEANGTTYTTIYDQTYNSNPAQNPVGIAFPFNT